MRSAREMRLRRVKCLRARGDLFHFTLRRQGRKISRLPQGKPFTSREAGYFTESKEQRRKGGVRLFERNKSLTGFVKCAPRVKYACGV